MNIDKLSAYQIPTIIEEGKISAEELIKVFIDRLKSKEDDINAYISFDEKYVLEQARAIDEKLKNGVKLGKLAGIPISIKDNISTKDIKTSCGSKMLDNYIATYDASLISYIKEEDGIIMGKVNLDEFAIGGSTETSYYGPSKNPINTELVPGGSSGGSAASVKSGSALISVGSDTGGSVRQPASFSGLVGIKPSYGTISRYGLVAMASSLDQAGVITKDVKDAYLMLDTIMKHDIRDSSSYKEASGILDNVDLEKRDFENLKIAYIKDFNSYEIDNDVKEVYCRAIDKIRSAGGNLEEIKMETLKYAPACYHVISTAETSSSLARYDGIIYGHRSDEYEDLDELYINSRSESLSSEVKRRIIFGSYILTGKNRDRYYIQALKVRRLIKDEFNKIFNNYDLILTPTAPCRAFKLGKHADDTEKQYRSDIFTVAANLAGLGAITLPIEESEGLPVGLQFTCNSFEDYKLIEAGLAYEGGNLNEL